MITLDCGGQGNISQNYDSDTQYFTNSDHARYTLSDMIITDITYTLEAFLWIIVSVIK